MRMTLTKDEVLARVSQGESLRQIALSEGVTPQSLQYHYRQKWGLPALKSYPTRGDTHQSWKGGRYVDAKGYVMVLAPDTGRLNKYIPEHILIAERELGRSLLSTEIVHHVNGKKTDNRWENLRVMDRSRHKTLHHQLERLAYLFFDSGAIVYDDVEGYRLDWTFI